LGVAAFPYCQFYFHTHTHTQKARGMNKAQPLFRGRKTLVVLKFTTGEENQISQGGAQGWTQTGTRLRFYKNIRSLGS